MLDMKFIRDNESLVRRSLSDRNVEADLDGFLASDRRFRQIVDQVNELKHMKNIVAKDIPREKDPAKKESLIRSMKDLNENLAKLEDESKAMDQKRNDLRMYIPNVPLPDVPVGPDAGSNMLIDSWGDPAKKDFTPKGHLEIGASLGMLDVVRGAKIAGAGFYVLKGGMAMMERALINFMIDIHNEQGYTETWVPALVNSKSMTGTGQLPKFKDDMYALPADDLYLVPTAEVPLTNLHNDEILDGGDLPIRYQAFTPCFRREAGRHAGEEGMIRVHQFSKVELVSICQPDDSHEELERLTDDAMEVLRRLDLPHRKMLLCTGDMTFSSAKTYDLEVKCPFGDRWMEISSCSLFTDFQARRAAIKYRQMPHLPSDFVHTLNGSGLAVGRTMVAILENYQNEDMSVSVPEALRPYMGGLKELTPSLG